MLKSMTTNSSLGGIFKPEAWFSAPINNYCYKERIFSISFKPILAVFSKTRSL